MLSFISSNKFTRAKYSKPLRKHLLKYHLIEYNDYTGKDVFVDASVDPIVIIIKKEIYTSSFTVKVNNIFQLHQSRFNEDSWSFNNPEILDLRDKINNKDTQIKNIENVKIYRSVLTGFNEAFIIPKKIKDKLIQEAPKNKEIIKPILRGRDIKKWTINYQNLYLIWTYIGVSIEDYPLIKKHLESYEEKLKKRSDQGNHWWELRHCNYYAKFKKPKIVYPEISHELFAVYDDNKFYLNDKCFMITSKELNLKFLGSLLSSKVLIFVFRLLSASLGKTGYELHKVFVEQLPIISATPEQQKPFIELADKILQLNKDLNNEINGFKTWLQRTYHIEKFSMKLERYYELTFEEFLAELKKKKVDTKTRKTQEVLKSEFEGSVEKIKSLKDEIAITDKKIDNMVYELYGLNDDETQLIEDSLKR